MLNGLYYFTKQDHLVTPTKCKLFNDEELFRLNASAQIMKRLFKNLDRSYAVKKAYEEFKAEVKRPNSENPYDRAEVDRRFRAFIFEWKLYTEHWKNYIRELTGSVYLDEFVKGYQELFDDLIDQAFKDNRFITAHVIRNYVSHANEAVTHAHVGKENEFFIGRSHMLAFLEENIAKTKGKKRQEQLEEQKAVIDAQPEKINLMTVADDAMVVMRWIETNLMNYQLEPQTLQAVSILTDAKKRIDDAGIESEVWELMSPTPLAMIDHSSSQMMTLEAVIDGKKVSQTVFRERVNWIGYQAIMDYIQNMIKRAQEAPQAEGVTTV